MPARTAGKNGEGGIFRDVDALEGTERFNLYHSDGTRLGTWEAVEGVTDDEFLRALAVFLDRKDSPKLRMVEDDSPVAIAATSDDSLTLRLVGRTT